MNLGFLLNSLEERLPELEWHLHQVGLPLSPQLLPKGLFRNYEKPTPALYVQEIKNNINQLALLETEQSAEYQAKKIHQKIDVLISFCCQRDKKSQTKKNIAFDLNEITTRQKRMQALENHILELKNQQYALKMRQEKLQKAQAEPMVLLNLEKDLGDLNKHLTLIEEQMRCLEI